MGDEHGRRGSVRVMTIYPSRGLAERN